jgi:hypothetical protein
VVLVLKGRECRQGRYRQCLQREEALLCVHGDTPVLVRCSTTIVYIVIVAVDTSLEELAAKTQHSRCRLSLSNPCQSTLTPVFFRLSFNRCTLNCALFANADDRNVYIACDGIRATQQAQRMPCTKLGSIRCTPSCAALITCAHQVPRMTVCGSQQQPQHVIQCKRRTRTYGKRGQQHSTRCMMVAKCCQYKHTLWSHSM